MTFVLKKKQRTFTWPVRVTMPNDKGQKVTNEFTGHFRLVEGDRFAALQDAWVNLFNTDPVESYAKRIELVTEVMYGWDGVVDDDTNEAVPFTDETIKLACRDAPFVRAVTDAYNEALAPEGSKKRRSGN